MTFEDLEKLYQQHCAASDTDGRAKELIRDIQIRLNLVPRTFRTTYHLTTGFDGRSTSYLTRTDYQKRPEKIYDGTDKELLQIMVRQILGSKYAIRKVKK